MKSQRDGNTLQPRSPFDFARPSTSLRMSEVEGRARLKDIERETKGL